MFRQTPPQIPSLRRVEMEINRYVISRLYSVLQPSYVMASHGDVIHYMHFAARCAFIIVFVIRGPPARFFFRQIIRNGVDDMEVDLSSESIACSM